MKNVIRLIDVSVTKADTGPVLDFIASTGSVDRYSEIIEPDGWRLDNYRKNPVFQNSHKYGDVVFTLGRGLITEVREIEGKKVLFQRVEFATEVNPVARIAYGLYAGGFLKAVSVGFMPIRWEDGTEKSGFSRRYLEQELLEVSAVAVPANAEALVLGLKSGAVSREDVEELVHVLNAMKPERRLWNFARELREVMKGVHSS